MAHPNSFYHYMYDWQSMQHDTLLSTLLKSCHHIMTCRNLNDVYDIISQVILQLRIDGYYRLEVCRRVRIEHFQGGHQVSYHGDRPQKGSENRTIKVVELEHAIIYKMHFMQLYLSKHQENTELLEENKNIWLLWLMHIESVCLQTSLESLMGSELSEHEQTHASSINFHLDLEINVSRLLQQSCDMYQSFNEGVMSVLTPADYIDPHKHQRLLVDAIRHHQEHLSTLIKEQYGLYCSSKRVLEAIKQSQL